MSTQATVGTISACMWELGWAMITLLTTTAASGAMRPNNLASDLRPQGETSAKVKVIYCQSVQDPTANHCGSPVAYAKTRKRLATNACSSRLHLIRKQLARTSSRNIEAVWLATVSTLHKSIGFRFRHCMAPQNGAYQEY